jgi:hypothetical protein
MLLYFKGVILHYLEKERIARNKYNSTYSHTAEKKRLKVGKDGAKHEYDLYEKDKVIGGVSTSPWKNKTGTNNTGGQDRAAAELLWLSLWNGKEHRVHILTSLEMAKNIYKKFKGTPFRKEVEVMHYNLDTEAFTSIGTVG